MSTVASPHENSWNAGRFLRFVAQCNSWPVGWRVSAAVGLVLVAHVVATLVAEKADLPLMYLAYCPAVSIAAMMTGVSGGIFASLAALILAHAEAQSTFDTFNTVRAASFLAGSIVVVGMARLLEIGRLRTSAFERIIDDEKRTKQFIEQAPVSIALFDRSMRCISCSRRWREDFALNGTEVVGKSYYDIFPGVSGAWKQIHQRGLAGETIRAEEDLFVWDGGNDKWIRWEVRPWHLNHDIAGLIVYSEDISDRKRSEEAVRASEAVFRAMFDNAAVGMTRVSPDGRFLAANEHVCEMLGYSAEEMTGITFRDVTHPDDLPLAVIKVKQLRSGEVTHFTHEKRSVRKDGSTLWTQVYVGGIFDARGALESCAGIILDISERKSFEDKLRQFSRVIEQTASSVLITNANGVIEYVNPHFSAVTGYASDEVLDKRPSILRSGQTVSRDYDQLWRTITSGQVWRGEFRNRRKDGSLYWEAATISPVRDSDGRITHFVAIQDDITLRKDMESRIAAAQRMEAVGRLAGGIAHDFNNLLAVIAGNLELIKQRTGDEEIKALAKPALDAVEAGSAFNRRLLSITGRRRSGAVSFLVNERLRDMDVLLKRTLRPNVSIRYELAGDLWPSLADPGELDSAVLNLVLNSRDAMLDGGEITVRTKNVAIDADRLQALPKEARAGDYVCVSVIDNGEGMSDAVFRQATEPFFTTKSEGRGTGLGLSSVQAFATECGGFITILSRIGEGTCVSVYLPRAVQPLQAESDPSQREAIPLGNGECVLVVEDDERVRDVTLKRVEALGYVAEPARSGAEALALLRSGLPVDLVLSDVVMPGAIDGLDLARRIRAEWPSMKVVLATGFSGEPMGMDLHTIGAPMLQKPYSRVQLAKTLASSLGSKAETPSALLIH